MSAQRRSPRSSSASRRVGELPQAAQRQRDEWWGGVGNGKRTRIASLEDWAVINGLTCANADLKLLSDR